MDNHLCGLNRHGDGVQSSEYTYTSEGFTKLCEALKGSAVTWLMCGAPPGPQCVRLSVNVVCPLTCARHVPTLSPLPPPPRPSRSLAQNHIGHEGA